MTTFWIVAGMLIAGASLYLLAPVLQRAAPGSGVARREALIALYRDQLGELEADAAAGVLPPERRDEARAEIERRLLDEVPRAADAAQPHAGGRRLAAGVIGVTLPAVVVGVYLLVGDPRALAPDAVSSGRPHGLDTRQVEAMAGRLAIRLQQDPDDAQGWVMLARSYTALRRYEDAGRAYANAVSRLPADAQLLADYADLLGMAQGRRLQGRPEEIIARALAVDANNVKALALAGTAALEKREFSAALDYWERVLRLVPPESAFAGSIRVSIAQARTFALDPGGGSQVRP